MHGLEINLTACWWLSCRSLVAYTGRLLVPVLTWVGQLRRQQKQGADASEKGA